MPPLLINCKIYDEPVRAKIFIRYSEEIFPCIRKSFYRKVFIKFGNFVLENGYAQLSVEYCYSRLSIVDFLWGIPYPEENKPDYITNFLAILIIVLFKNCILKSFFRVSVMRRQKKIWNVTVPMRLRRRKQHRNGSSFVRISSGVSRSYCGLARFSVSSPTRSRLVRWKNPRTITFSLGSC